MACLCGACRAGGQAPARPRFVRPITCSAAARTGAGGGLGAVPAQRPEGVVVVYDGGVPTPAAIVAVTVPDDELAGYAFMAPADVPPRVTPLVGRRIASCLQALAADRLTDTLGGSAIRRTRCRAGACLYLDRQE